MNMRFDQVPIGGEFECQGERFKKIALSMTHNRKGWGVIFLYDDPVDYDGPPAPPAARTVFRRGGAPVGETRDEGTRTKNI